MTAIREKVRKDLEKLKSRGPKKQAKKRKRADRDGAEDDVEDENDEEEESAGTGRKSKKQKVPAKRLTRSEAAKSADAPRPKCVARK
jgi:hypothetical protein